MLTVRILGLILVWLLASPAVAGNLTVPLGNKKVTISVTGRGSPTCVALHSNEATSIGAVSGLCGTLIVLKNGGARDITFSLDGVSYRVDPNRMFTKRGRLKDITPKATPAVEKAVKALADTITAQFSGSPLIGLHNNSNGSYSVHTYQGRGAHIVPGQDSDNFVLTNDGGLYKKAVALGYNAYLERGGADDGSLSIYWGGTYLNVEAQPGSGSWQKGAYQNLLRKKR